MRPFRYLVPVVALGLLLPAGCVQRVKRELKPAEQAVSLDGRSPFLKAHLLDGRVYVLSQWKVDEQSRTISGQGEMLGLNREVLATGALTVRLDEVALFETNVVKQSPSVTALAVVTGASAAMTVVCATNPKTCFGSCPTFHVTDGRQELLQAEGFSASITRALEATDVDALYRARPGGRRLEVRMTNEALETHVVRSVRVLAAPRPRGGRVLAATDGSLWQARQLAAPTRCAAAEGDCLKAVEVLDGLERFSTSDGEDLASRETIDLEFAAAPGARVGVGVGFRQTLLSTFLLYQGLAYLGSSASGWLAALERSDSKVLRQASGLGGALGGIEVLVPDGAGGWSLAGQVHETGPLAGEVQFVPLPEPVPAGPVRIRLRLTRGHWRLDWVGLAALGARVEPLRLEPRSVRRGPVEDARAREILLDPRRVLTTLPGDEYTLLYELPRDFEAYELFLESRGYYLEWMRQEWLAEEDPARAALMLLSPRAALRELAPAFKQMEPTMESTFWRSRYARP
jgi:hypothetical protein